MNIADIVQADSVLSPLHVQNKKQLLTEIASALAAAAGVEARPVFDALLQREKLGSTGLGQGIAIPHGRIAGLTKVHGVFARLSHPVAFDATDGEPVDLVFALASPPQSGADHLTALARVSRLLRDPITLAKLRGTESPDGLYAILTQPAATATAA
jgi:nitrogen PTS system EIIA component